MTPRLIEHALPLKELSAQAQREKAIRHGHISTLHVWWARRPLVVARAAVLGALVDADAMDDIGFQKFVANLCRWEVNDGDSIGRHLLEQARDMIHRRFPDGPPKVLDSFAGGGSIPLEALRLGCEAHAVEYNPVAYLILKATLEYPQRYGPKLAEDVRRWGEWVLEHAKEELAGFYPSGPNGETVVAYIWSRTVRCPNPTCGAEIPLFRQFWLARKPNKRVALYPVVDREHKRVDFEILAGSELEWTMGAGFDPSQGTVRRANATCPVCGSAAGDDYIRQEAEVHRLGHRLVALVTTAGRGQGRNYYITREEDLRAFQRAAERLEELNRQPSPWPNGLVLIPDEPSPGTIGQGASARPTYGLTQWGFYFNPRQALALVTFGKWVREAIREVKRETDDPDYAKAVGTYLAFGIHHMANYSCLLSGWDNRGETMWNTFSGHNLHIAWSYGEANPLSGATASWSTSVARIILVIAREAMPYSSTTCLVNSATALPYDDATFDAVVIDPPYYDNVPYSDLSDFFYVWLKRTVGDLYPEAFQWELTPKDEEAVANPARFGGGRKGEEIARRHYVRLMGEAFREIHRVLKPEGLAVVMFTHKSTTAWEGLIGSLLEAGLYPTASWPVHTEMEASTHQRGKGSVRSTILMACRRRPEDAGVGWYHRVREELSRTVGKRLKDFWDMGIRGADFFISAIGPAVGVFGRYRKVMRPDGRPVEVGDLLDEVRTLATQFALERLGRDLGLVDAPTRFYVIWRWAYGGGELEFDEANKLAKSLGVELDELEHQRALVRRRGQAVALPDFWRRLGDGRLSRYVRRTLEEGNFQQIAIIDALHIALFLWRRGERRELAGLLALGGFLDEDHPFWHVAQALYEVEGAAGEGALKDEVTALGQMLPSQDSLVRQATQATSEARQLRLDF